MAFLDDLQRALINWRAGRPAILPPPEPGSASGQPAPPAGQIMPVAGDGTPLLDSGLHCYQPKDVGSLKYNDRFRRLVNLQAGMGLQDYLGTLFPALVVNAIGPEDMFPDDLLAQGVVVVGQTAAKVSVCQLQNPPKSGRAIIIEAVQVTRHQTAGQVEVAITGQANSQTGATNFTSYGPRDGRAAGVVGLIDGAIPAAVGGAPFTSAIQLASGVISQSGVATIPLAILLPGQIYQAFPTTIIGAQLVNEGLTMNVWTREIKAFS